ncbi:hypothetical protein AK812_SmicGene43138 [Symbiodinium microadriaticum]|uniref:Uncharacterized protein n=1 Tax=Symbiodinium microadriaticum TaxID=2951 RepID=A0A1Q9C1T4_SYMMI|nr:hypothetical protein AK812_SmicGene43138 [Symbiodinium microadriaticum]
MYGRRSRGLSRAISLMRTALVSPPSTISLNTSSTMFLASAAPVLFSPFAHRLLRILMQPPMSTFAYHLDGHPQARYLAQFVQAVAHKHLATRELDPQEYLAEAEQFLNERTLGDIVGNCFYPAALKAAIARFCWTLHDSVQPPPRALLSAPLLIFLDTTEAGEDDPYPLGSFPCTKCQAVAAKGMLFSLKCKAPQSDDTTKVTKKFFENKGLRMRLLATAAAGSRKPVENLISADFRQLNARAKKRGQMSAEATVIRDAKDRVIRAKKLNHTSVAERWENDDVFQRRMMQEGRIREDMYRFDCIARACLPDRGRSEVLVSVQ